MFATVEITEHLGKPKVMTECLLPGDSLSLDTVACASHVLTHRSVELFHIS